MVFSGLGVFFLLVGLLFVGWPGWVEKFQKLGQKILFVDEGMLSHHKITGTFFLIAAALMFLFAYWIEKWHLSEFFRKLLL